MGLCRFCSENVGLFRSEHKACKDLHLRGIQQMANVAAVAATGSDFNEAALRNSLADIAEQSFASEDDINRAIAKGWSLSVHYAISDSVLTREEEDRLRRFRDRMAVMNGPDAADASAALQRGTEDRLLLAARIAALSTEAGNDQLNRISEALRQTDLTDVQIRHLLVRAWETAVQGALEDGVISLDEESALVRYLNYFGLAREEVNVNGAHSDLTKAAVIREVASGVIPERQQLGRRVPFNVMKSETLVWVLDGVSYLETVTRRESRGTSHGLSIRVTKGLYYRPGMFRSRLIQWDETVHVDTGLMGFTTKHIYFSGTKKRFRVRYDRIVAFEPYEDGIGIMRDAQTAKPQSFVTGDGWFTYNLATNLAQL